jgi:periplasmic protein TonB
MTFRSLKFITTAIMGFVSCALVTACNDEGNNSTTTNDSSGKMDNTATGPSSTTGDTGNTNTGKAVKKTGKALVNAVDDAGAKIEKDKMGYYTNTEVQPSYSGGHSSLESYINNNIEYPQQAIDNSAEGTVKVHFLIDDKGNISNVTTEGNKIGYGLEEEAVRVISKMSKWTPGQVKGKNVKTWRTLPIIYKLES